MSKQKITMRFIQWNRCFFVLPVKTAGENGLKKSEEKPKIDARSRIHADGKYRTQRLHMILTSRQKTAVPIRKGGKSSMDTQSVQICFSTEDDAPSLASCLEQLLRNVRLKSQEET